MPLSRLTGNIARHNIYTHGIEKLSLAMRKLQRLRAIQAFEAVARNESYVAAAVELNVTPAAIGQQVRALEQWVGVDLFKRIGVGPKRLVLTELGQLALPEFREGLDRLDAGLRRLLQKNTRVSITISASQAFVARWLLPRLDGFTSQYNEIDIKLDVTDRLVDIEHGDADIAIRCGAGNWPGIESIKLMDEEVFPVCSPNFLIGKRLPMKPAALADFTLIHDLMMKETKAFPYWQTWFKKFGMNDEKISHGLQINSSTAVIQAAIAGQGLALVRKTFVLNELSTGQLIRLVPEISWPVTWGYYLVFSRTAINQSTNVLFIDWIKSLLIHDLK
jgi:LysR family transcriptional regulator, glycine cleavage system transcriptional activator